MIPFEDYQSGVYQPLDRGWEPGLTEAIKVYNKSFIYYIFFNIYKSVWCFIIKHDQLSQLYYMNYSVIIIDMIEWSMK